MISSYFLISTILYQKNRSIYKSLTHALIVWTLYVYIWCLLLSMFALLRYEILTPLYIVTNMVMIVHLYRLGGKRSLFGLAEQIKDHVTKQIEMIREDRMDTVLTVFVFLFVVCLGIVACFAVPYNYDSIDYHAPRICFWVQNHSVSYYATEVTRQVFSPVLASYIATFAYILTGKWQSAMCIIQYGAYVINLILILYICNMLGVKRKLRYFATILWITLPIGFAEAITPQNDLCAATWLLIFVIEIMHLMRKVQDNETGVSNKGIYSDIVILAVCIALGYLTKPSVCFAMVIFLFAYLMTCIKNRIKISSLFLQCMLAMGVIVILICPQMIQNYKVLGTITSELAGKRQLVGTVKPNYLFVNMFKDLIHNLGFKIGIADNEEVISNIVYKLGDILRVDVNSVTISEDGVLYGFPSLPCYSCDAALNATLYIFVIISLIIFCVCNRRFESEHRMYIVSSFIAFLFLCVMLRWEKSITRYMIAYFSLLIVAVACVFSVLLPYTEYNEKRRSFKKHIIAVAIVCTVFMVGYDVYNELYDLYKLHPVFPTKSTLTMYHDKLDDYYEACGYINDMKIEELGLIESGCPGDYAIWRMLDDDIVIRSVNLPENNPLKNLEEIDVIPQAILCYEDRGDSIDCHGEIYYRTLSNSSWNVYSLR